MSSPNTTLKTAGRLCNVPPGAQVHPRGNPFNALQCLYPDLPLINPPKRRHYPFGVSFVSLCCFSTFFSVSSCLFSRLVPCSSLAVIITAILLPLLPLRQLLNQYRINIAICLHEDRLVRVDIRPKILPIPKDVSVSA